MHSSIALIFALTGSALAAPFASSDHAKSNGVFKISVPPRANRKVAPKLEMERTFAKFGWKLPQLDTRDTASSDLNLDGDDWIWSISASTIVVTQTVTQSTYATQPLAQSTPVNQSSSQSTFATQYSSQSASATHSSSRNTSATPSSSPSTSATQPSSENERPSPSAYSTATGQASGTGFQTGQVTASPQTDDSEYLVPVQIGTPAQTLNMDIDTGSADLWVFSNSLPSSESSGHTLFDSSSSTSFTPYADGTWQIQYGDGSTASGNVGFDEVVIGGATVTKQAIEIATQVAGSFESDTANDGLVGLAFSSINTVQPQQQQTFFENLKGQLRQYLFTANLEEDATGTYTFGEIDPSQYTGDIHSTPIDNSHGFWQIPFGTYYINGQAAECTTCSPVVIDTGSSLLLLDTDIVSAFYQSVGGQFSSQQGGYVYDCSRTLPDLGLTVGNFTATVPGSSLLYAEVGPGTCFGAVQGNGGQGTNIFGDAFLKNFFAVFDGDALSFGVAEKAASSS